MWIPATVDFSSSIKLLNYQIPPLIDFLELWASGWANVEMRPLSTCSGVQNIGPFSGLKV